MISIRSNRVKFDKKKAKKNEKTKAGVMRYTRGGGGGGGVGRVARGGLCCAGRLSARAVPFVIDLWSL